MSVTPDFVGQRYKDTNTGNIWIANSTTPGDWTLEVQNYGIKWTPRSLSLLGKAGWISEYNGSGFGGLASLSIECETCEEYLFIQDLSDLVTLSFPNLTDCLPESSIKIAVCAALTTVDFPNLETIQCTFDGLSILANPLLATINVPELSTVDELLAIETNPSLVTLSMPSLTSAGGVQIKSNAALTTINLPLWVPSVDTIDFSGNALSESSVDTVLSKCVSNPLIVGITIDLSGGTNSPPSASGLADKATLQARVPACTVLVNS